MSSKSIYYSIGREYNRLFSRTLCTAWNIFDSKYCRASSMGWVPFSTPCATILTRLENEVIALSVKSNFFSWEPNSLSRLHLSIYLYITLCCKPGRSAALRSSCSPAQRVWYKCSRSFADAVQQKAVRIHLTQDFAKWSSFFPMAALMTVRY